jgi:telomere length regulation protein
LTSVLYLQPIPNFQNYQSIMADFLTAVSTKKVKAPEPLLREVKSLSVQDAVHIESAKSLLEALKSQPDQQTVSSALGYMTADGFSLLLPEPLNASIAHQLVNDTIPHYWRSSRDSALAKAYAKVLRNPTGIGHIFTRLRSLIADSRQKTAPEDARDPSDHIEDMLEVLNRIFQGKDTSSLVLRDVLAHGKHAMQKKLIWREYLAQTASGRLVSIVAEAEDVLKSKEGARTVSWLADGNAFAIWLGRNIAHLMQDADKSDEYISAVAELSSKALTLGYTGELR